MSPNPNYILYGIVKDDDGLIQDNATVVVTNVTEDESSTTGSNPNGEYTMDLSTIGFSQGDVIEVLGYFAAKGSQTQSFTLGTEATKELNITLAYPSADRYKPLNRDNTSNVGISAVSLLDFAGNLITPDNPLSVSNPIKSYVANETASSGSISHVTTVSFKAQIHEIIIKPTTSTTSYNINIITTDNGYAVVKYGPQTRGTRQFKTEATVVNETITINVTNASKNEIFTFEVRYR